MTYKIEIKKSALKFIKKQDRASQKRILQAIRKLPFEGDIKKLKNRAGYRFRVGNFRIIFITRRKDVFLFLKRSGSY